MRKNIVLDGNFSAGGQKPNTRVLARRQRIINIDVDVIDLNESVKYVHDLALEKKGGYICLSNVHMCMESLDDIELRTILQHADLVLPDGKPLSWAQQLLGHSNGTQVRGQDLMERLCEMGKTQTLNIGLYGGESEELLLKVKKELLRKNPNLKISFAFAPPFRPLTPSEDAHVISQIKKAKVDILFVGIGCPKQERWMKEHKKKISSVMVGVGAAFDFAAGCKRSAPRWMQKIGFEWLFRLVAEPKRLWKRYLKQNPRFICYFLQQWLFDRKYR
ncbi:MAG: WecB/TagA/CpsF family glycosyltransferase [Nitrospinota bacterium]